MPQHNLAIEHGQGEVRDANPDDEAGTGDSELPHTGMGGERQSAPDHRGRARRLDPRAVHLSGPNPELAALEEDHDEAALAALPAWYDDEDVSPRDPLYALTRCEGSAFQASICSPRAAVTAHMHSIGQTRPIDRPVHW